jgi:hypothetical protein
MRKLLLVFAIVSGVTITSVAQNSPSRGFKKKLGIGLDLGLPMGGCR